MHWLEQTIRLLTAAMLIAVAVQSNWSEGRDYINCVDSRRQSRESSELEGNVKHLRETYRALAECLHRGRMSGPMVGT